MYKHNNTNENIVQTTHQDHPTQQKQKTGSIDTAKKTESFMPVILVVLLCGLFVMFSLSGCNIFSTPHQYEIIAQDDRQYVECLKNKEPLIGNTSSTDNSDNNLSYKLKVNYYTEGERDLVLPQYVSLIEYIQGQEPYCEIDYTNQGKINSAVIYLPETYRDNLQQQIQECESNK